MMNGNINSWCPRYETKTNFPLACLNVHCPPSQVQGGEVQYSSSLAPLHSHLYPLSPLLQPPNPPNPLPIFSLSHFAPPSSSPHQDIRVTASCLPDFKRLCLLCHSFDPGLCSVQTNRNWCFQTCYTFNTLGLISVFKIKDDRLSGANYIIIAASCRTEYWTTSLEIRPFIGPPLIQSPTGSRWQSGRLTPLPSGLSPFT